MKIEVNRGLDRPPLVDWDYVSQNRGLYKGHIGDADTDYYWSDGKGDVVQIDTTALHIYCRVDLSGSGSVFYLTTESLTISN